MFWRILLIALVTLTIGLAGCEKKKEPGMDVPTAVEEVKKEAEAAADEAADVDVEAEVDELEKEIEADMEE